MTAESNTVSFPSEKPQQEETADSPKVDIEEDKWLIRESDLYYDEYKECTSFRARFQQYFVFGETLDCNQWKKDYDNSCKWESKNDIKAANNEHNSIKIISFDVPKKNVLEAVRQLPLKEALIISERNRRLERLRAHYRNDTWKPRDSPPADWDKPLPDWMSKRNENSFLTQKAQELKEGKVEDSKSSCSVM